jgi:hypothetical protein
MTARWIAALCLASLTLLPVAAPAAQPTKRQQAVAVPPPGPEAPPRQRPTPGQLAREAELEALRARQTALARQLSGQGFTVVIEPPFVVVGDEAPAKVRARASGFLRWAVTLLEKDWFSKRPEQIIEVWLFKNEQTYRRGAKKHFDDEPETPYGYYSPADHALIMNIGPGAGTLSHELVHPYMEANFPGAPAWFNEGVASLYEQPRERDGRLWGTTNWRLTGLQRGLKDRSLPSLQTMMATSSDEFYGAAYDSYAMARFLCQYLQDHGKLRAFYEAFVADAEDPTGATALAAVLGMDLAAFEPKWRSWAMGLRR